MLLIGIDIGTTSICGILYDRDSGKTLQTQSVSNNYIDEQSAAQSPSEILSKVHDIINKFITFSKSSLIEGLSISSQMHGILYVDKEGEAITPFYTWQNQWGSIPDKEEEISSRLNFNVYTGYGIVTHLLNPKVKDNSRYFCNIGDYILMKLSGNKIPISDISIAASMGIWNVEKNCIVSEYPTESYLFPKVVSSPTLIGEYKGIKLVQALGDNQASFLGSVPNLDKSILLNYGTSGQISFYSEDSFSFEGFEKRPLGEGYLYVAFSLSGGDSFKLLANFFTEIMNLGDTDEINSIYEILDKFDISKINSEGITFSPYFLGKRGLDKIDASITGLTKLNFHPLNIFRALLEGITQELYQYYILLPSSLIQSKNILIGAGNGIKKNKNLRTVINEYYRREIQLSDVIEDSCIGAIIHLSCALELDKNYRDGIEFINRV
jgi:sedoheptulokinase